MGMNNTGDSSFLPSQHEVYHTKAPEALSDLPMSADAHLGYINLECWSCFRKNCQGNMGNNKGIHFLQDKPKYCINKAKSESDITCCLVQLLKMSFREPDLMDSYIHCASSTVNNDVTVSQFAKGRGKLYLHQHYHNSILQ